MEYLNEKTKSTLARCTPEALSVLPMDFLVQTPSSYADESVLCVSKMSTLPALPALPGRGTSTNDSCSLGLRADALSAQGPWKASNCWLELNLSDDTIAAIHAWRRDYAASTGATFASSQLPEPHVTICFAHCPAAEEAKRALVAAMPSAVFPFSHVKALGPAGRENCWVAVLGQLDDPNDALVAYLASARNDATLNTKHASYVERDGWKKNVDEFGGSIIPHVTLVRGLQDMDIAHPPPLSNLFPDHFAGAVFTSITEWAGIESIGTDGKPVKIKLCMHHPRV